VPVTGGRFGESVAISGDRIVVGAGVAPFCCPDPTDPGRAYVFRRIAIDAWVEEAMLLPTAGDNDDFFGGAVAIDGDVIAVGARGDDDIGSGSGAVYVFRRNGSAWNLEQKLLPAPNSSSSGMGQSVAVEADVLIAGSSTAFRVFERGSNGQWQEKQLEPPPPFLSFSGSLALQGTLLAAGASGVPGTVLLYEKSGPRWELLQTLTPSNATGGGGSSVSLAGSILVAGARGNDASDGTRPGAAYVFRETAGGWVQSQRLVGSLSADGDVFGDSVATDGTYIFVGAPLADEDFTLTTGEAYVFADSAGNAIPTAEAGTDATVECTGLGGAAVTLDGSASSDTDSTPGTNDALVSFEWLEGTTSLGLGEVLQVVLPLGPHTITLRVMDAQGAQDEDTVAVNVVDTLPPGLTVSLAPSLLWPPNHRLVDVTASLQVTGVCVPSTITLESVVSDEPDDAPGGADGSTTGDVQDAATGTDDRAFRLRAERSSQGAGRTYTATYRVVETGGASATASANAFVPHSQNGTADPIVLTLLETPVGTEVDWTPVPGNPVYNVARGRLQELVADEDALSLGNVRCLERASWDAGTAGFEDTEGPLPGEVFVYVVEYDDGARVSYGAESAGKPRIVLAGDCP
jgi:hypothetical protein